jgi:hypothetical protein
LLLGLSPDSDALISTHSYEVISDTGHSETPDSSEEAIEREDLFERVTVHHFDFTVLGRSEDIVGVSDEPDTSDTVLMKENTFVDITELHAPNLEILISRACGQESAVT